MLEIRQEKDRSESAIEGWTKVFVVLCSTQNGEYITERNVAEDIMKQIVDNGLVAPKDIDISEIYVRPKKNEKGEG